MSPGTYRTAGAARPVAARAGAALIACASVAMGMQGQAITQAQPPAPAGTPTAAAAGAAPTSAAPTIAAQPRVYLLRVQGDLLYMKTATDFRAQLVSAARQEMDCVVVRLSGQAARADVVLDMIHAVRESTVPVVIELVDSRVSDRFDSDMRRDSDRVHPGLLAFGIASPRFAINSRLRVTNWTLPALDVSSDARDREQVFAELIELVESGLMRRGLDEEQARTLARAIVTPADPLWGTIEPSAVDSRAVSVTFFAVEPSAQAGRPAPMQLVSKEPGGPAIFNLAAKHAVDLCCADALGPDLDEWLGWEYSRVARADEHSLEGGDYGKRAALAPVKMKSVDNFLKHIEPVLDLPDPAKRSVSKDKYRAAGTLALEKLKQTEEEIAALEGILRDLPEVLLTPPPGQTDVGAKPSSFAAKWRSMIQSRRDKVEKLRAKAEEFAKE